MNSSKKKKTLTPLEKKRRKYIRHQRFMRFFTFLFCLVLALYLVVGAVGIGMLNKLTKGMPELKVSDFVSNESSCVYDANGNVLVELGTYLRENVSYDEIPESLVDAFLSIEDSRFFEHNGFDIPRITKSAIQNLAGGSLTEGAGGSTFTMQLVKNTYFSKDAGDESTTRTADMEYKVQQIVLSLQLEKKLDKKKIFELYVNKLNFGKNIRGAQMASRYYFGKEVTQLNLSEAALLAGIVNMPNTYNPYSYLDYATERRNTVLNMMVLHGYITQEECTLAKSINVEDQLVGEYKTIKRTDSKYAEYIDRAIAEAIELTGFDPSNVGMSIYTAMIPEIQNTINNIESNKVDSVVFPDEDMQTAIITMNNQTGEIVGIGGGRNYGESGGSMLMNRAFDQPQQPGSCIKPVISYALGFEYLGYSLDEMLEDKKISYPGESRTLVNWDGKYRGIVSIKDAMANSLNIPAILTLESAVKYAGLDTVVDYLNALGFTDVTTDNFHYSIAIGGNDFRATVVQIAGAHSAIVNGGVYNKPHTIRKIHMSNTGEIIEPDGLSQRVLSSGSSYLVCKLMQNNNECSIFNWQQVLRSSYPVYSKTGTTDWGSSGLVYGIPNGSAKEKWMIASTSQFTNAVWLGYDPQDAGPNAYFTSWKDNYNTTGYINRTLLDAEYSLSSERINNGVTKPADVVMNSYIQKTFPHVAAGAGSGSIVTSEVSATGLANLPNATSMSQSSVLQGKTPEELEKEKKEKEEEERRKQEEEERKAQEEADKQQNNPVVQPDPEPTPVPEPPVVQPDPEPTPVPDAPADPAAVNNAIEQ